MANKVWIGGDAAGANSVNVAANWSPSGVPTGSDNVYFTHQSTSSCLHDLATLAAITGELHIKQGYLQSIGSSTGPNYFEMKPSVVYANVVRPAFIDVKASTGVIHIENTGGGSYASAGLNLLGTAIGRINMLDGTVAVALNPGEVSTIAEIELTSSGKLMLGSGVTWTDVSQYGGTLTATAGTTNSVVDLYGGTFSADQACKVKDLNVFDGTVFWSGTGNVKNLTMRGGIVNTLYSGQNRTFTNARLYEGEIAYDPNVLTITNWLQSDTPVNLTVRR